MHDSAVGKPAESTGTGELHELPLYVSTLPCWSTALQNELDTHESTGELPLNTPKPVVSIFV